MQRRGTNVVVGEDRHRLGAKELDVLSVVKRNRKQITAVLVSSTVFVILLSKYSQRLHQSSSCLQFLFSKASLVFIVELLLIHI